MDTTIKVDSAVRDRLALLARERGVTIRELVARLADETLTAGELRARQAAATDYIRTHLAPDLTDEDLAAADAVLDAIDAGEPPSTLTRPGGSDRRRAA